MVFVLFRNLILYKFLMFEAFEMGMFLELSSFWFYVIDLLLVLCFTVLLFLFYRPKFELNNPPFKPFVLLLIIISSFAFRVFEDPIINFKFILSNEKSFLFNEIQYPLNDKIIIFLFFVIFAPFMEELFYRKIILNIFKKSIYAIAFSSILFGAVHLSNGISVFSFFTTVLFGILLCLIFYKFGFFYCFAFHAIYNLLFFLNKYIFPERYYETISQLNYNFYYWSIVFLSILFLIFFVRWIINDKKYAH